MGSILHTALILDGAGLGIGVGSLESDAILPTEPEAFEFEIEHAEAEWIKTEAGDKRTEIDLLIVDRLGRLTRVWLTVDSSGVISLCGSRDSEFFCQSQDLEAR